MLGDDSQDALDGRLVADQHDPPVVRQTQVGCIEVFLLCEQPNRVHDPYLPVFIRGYLPSRRDDRRLRWREMLSV